MAGNVIATLLVKIGVEVKEMTKGIKQVEGKMKGLKSGFGKTAKALGAIFTGQQVVNGFKSVISESNKFQLNLSKLNTIAGLSEKDLKGVAKSTQSLASTFGVSSNDIAGGLTELAKLGYDTTESLKQMPAMLKFNVGAGTDFHTTVGLMETVLKDFDKELGYTGKATDIFSAAIAKGRLTANDLSDAFKKAGLSGKNAGASVSDVAAATSKLAIKGFSGAEAGTALNAIFGNLTKTGGNAQKKLKDLGISVTDSSGKMRPFGELVSDIQRKFQGLTDAEKNEAAQLVAGKEHMAKFLGVVSGAPGSFEEYSTSLENADGATQKAFEGIDNTAQQSLNKLSSTFETFQQNIGDALSPAVSAVSDAIAGLLDWFNQLSPGMQEFIGYAAAGVGIFFAIAAALSIMALAFASLSLPLILIVAGIAIVVAAFIALWNHSDEIIAGIKAGWDALGDWMSSLWEGIKSVVSAFGQFFVDLWNSIVDGVIAAFLWLYNHNIYFKALVDFIVSIFNKVKTFLMGVWKTISSFLIQKWTAIKDKASSIFTAIKGVVTSIWSSISKTIKGWASQAYQWGANFLNMLINGIKSKVKAITDTVKGIGKSIAHFLGFRSPTEKGPLANSDQWMPNFMNMLEEGIETGIPKLQMAIGDVAATLDIGNEAASSVVNNTINVNSRQNNLNERGLARMLERMRILNGGAI